MISSLHLDIFEMSTITLVWLFVVTVPGVLLNLAVIYISVYKVNKPYKWFVANLAITDLIFAVATMVGQPIFVLRQLRDQTLSLEHDFVSFPRLLSSDVRSPSRLL